MTELDTAAIRAAHTEAWYDDYQFDLVRHCRFCGRDSHFPCLPLKLADALDAARAERDAAVAFGNEEPWGNGRQVVVDTLRGLRDRAEAAEARAEAALGAMTNFLRQARRDPLNVGVYADGCFDGAERMQVVVQQALTGGAE